MKTFTVVHVVISLVGILSGFVVLFGLLASKRRERWTATFLATTVATSVTGFLFPFRGVTPAVITGVISMVVLGMAIYALYQRRLVGAWRAVYVVSAITALYLNVFVAVVQAFLKVPSLNALAPKQTEPPFLISQLIVLIAFIAFGILAFLRFRAPAPIAAEHKAFQASRG